MSSDSSDESSPGGIIHQSGAGSSSGESDSERQGSGSEPSVPSDLNRHGPFPLHLTQVNPEISELLVSCFDEERRSQQGLPVNSRFNVRGQDGERQVEIEFEVTGTGLYCELIWRYNSRGFVNSVWLDGGEDVQIETYGSETPEIILEIHGRDPDDEDSEFRPYLLIQSLHPSNLVHGKFVRSIVYQLATSYQALFWRGMYVKVNFDVSKNREMYWMTKGTGKTYFEGVWGLEYEFILEMESAHRVTFMETSLMADALPAAIAFDYQGYEPIRNRQYSTDPEGVHRFDQEFIQEMEQYKERHPTREYGVFTIGEIVRDFLHNLQENNMLHDPERAQIYAQNTFMYFYRGHPSFHRLARQVLQGYDTEAFKMRGMPHDPQPCSLTFNFRFQRMIVSTNYGASTFFSNPIFTSLLIIATFFIITFKFCLQCSEKGDCRQKVKDFDMYNYSEL